MIFYNPVITCPPEIRGIADSYKDLLGSHYKAFVAVLCGTIFGIKCLSNFVRFLMFSPSVSSLSRFLQTEDISKKLNRRHRRRIQKLLIKQEKNPKRYIWAIDDTLLQGYGQKTWGSYYWFDHTSNSTVRGQKLLVLGLVDRHRKVLVPVFWEILHRKDEEKPELYKKGWQIALGLLDSALEMGFPKLPVVFDSWFAGEELFSALEARDLPFVVEIKSNRKVSHHGRKKVNESVQIFFSSFKRKKILYWGKKKWACEAILWFQGAKKKMKVIAVANKKGLVHECFAYYVSNRLTWDATKIWGLARDRWAIEVQFRELKQLFTLGGAAVQSKNSVETTISVAAIGLTEIRLEQLHRVDANENQYIQPVPAGKIVSEYQLKSMRRSFFTLVTNSSAKDKVNIRLHPENFGRKPTEEIKNYQPPNGIDQQRKIA